MKKNLLIIGVVMINTISAQLRTSGGTVGSTLSTAPANNVGIGTNNPESLLDIRNRIYINPEAPVFGIGIRAYDTYWSRGYNFLSGDGKTKLGGFSAVGPSGGVDYYYIGKEYNNNSARFYPADNKTIFYGNIGVGTDAPQAKLDVRGDFRAQTGDNYLYYNGAADIQFRYLERGQGGRAIVHEGGNILAFNYLNDFSGGTKIGTSFLVKGNDASLQGKLEAKEIKVTLTPTADFVFDEKYDLPKLEEIEQHIKEKKHLPEIASAKEMEKEGVNVGEFQIKLLQKIEELTLYTIEQNKRLKQLEEDNRDLIKEVEKIKNR